MKQLQLEEKAMSCTDKKLIVMDRCILDTYLYCIEAMGRAAMAIESIYKLLMPTYDIFCLFDPRDVSYSTDEVRCASSDHVFRARWHGAFLEALKTYHEKVIVVSGDLYMRVNTVQRVMEDILSAI